MSSQYDVRFEVEIIEPEAGIWFFQTKMWESYMTWYSVRPGLRDI